MSIYTRRGDDGETSIGDGSRRSKANPRVEAYGTVDEANSAVGAARAAITDDVLDEVLRFVQHRLFNCSSSLATPVESHTERTPVITEDDIAFLERTIDLFEARAGEVHHFVIEAGSEAAARLHVARAVMRRAERRIVTLAAEEPIAEHVLAFVNRCSDLLYAAARYANATASVDEERWDPGVRPPSLP